MGDACERPRTAHKSEFAQLGEQLEKAEDLLQQAAQGEPSAGLAALAAASAELEPMGSRAQVFVKRADYRQVLSGDDHQRKPLTRQAGAPKHRQTRQAGAPKHRQR